MNRARTYRCTRIRRWVARSNDTETLPLRPSCRGRIIATRGYDFRKGQVDHAKTLVVNAKVLVVLPVLLVRVPVAPRVATDVTPLTSHDDET